MEIACENKALLFGLPSLLSWDGNNLNFCSISLKKSNKKFNTG